MTTGNPHSRFRSVRGLLAPAVGGAFLFLCVYATIEYALAREWFEGTARYAGGTRFAADLEAGRQHRSASLESLTLGVLDMARIERPLRCAAVVIERFDRFALAVAGTTIAAGIGSLLGVAARLAAAGCQISVLRRRILQPPPAMRSTILHATRVALLSQVLLAPPLWYFLDLPVDLRFRNCVTAWSVSQQCDFSSGLVAAWWLGIASIAAAVSALHAARRPVTALLGLGAADGQVCWRCGYDARRAVDRCPECAAPTEAGRSSLAAPVRIAVLASLVFAALFLPMVMAVFGVRRAELPITPQTLADWFLLRATAFHNTRRAQIIIAYRWEELLLVWPADAAILIVREVTDPSAVGPLPTRVRVVAAVAYWPDRRSAFDPTAGMRVQSLVSDAIETLEPDAHVLVPVGPHTIRIAVSATQPDMLYRERLVHEYETSGLVEVVRMAPFRANAVAGVHLWPEIERRIRDIESSDRP